MSIDLLYKYQVCNGHSKAMGTVDKILSPLKFHIPTICKHVGGLVLR